MPLSSFIAEIVTSIRQQIFLLAYGVVLVSCQDEEDPKAVAEPAEGVQKIYPSATDIHTLTEAIQRSVGIWVRFSLQ
jgi:hypothetical protein